MFNIPNEIKTALGYDRLILFIGSGFSVPLGIPNWNNLALKIINQYSDINNNVHLLEKCLEKNVLDEILVFDALKNISKSRIHKIIKDNINIHIDNSKLHNHKKVWEISKKIITTNYDKSLEVSKPSTKIDVVTSDSIDEITTSFKNNEWLFHLHGRIDRIDECIIFSEDYIKLYSKEHRAIEQLKHLIDNTILFIGFSMNDKYVSKLFNELDVIFKGNLSTNHFIILKETEQPPKGLKKISIQSYAEIPQLLDHLIEIKKSSSQCEIPIQRFLRRRCRGFSTGTNSFNNLVNQLLHVPILTSEKKDINNKINDFKNEYEKTILLSLYWENFGEIEKMISVLEKVQFKQEKELTRKLYLAIALEKIDYINDSIKLLNEITSFPSQSEIAKSAQFNLCICYEKINEYDKVYFEYYIQKDFIITSTKESMKEKAINNELIVCHKQNKEFRFEKELELTLNNSKNQSPKSFYKTLINYYTYKKIKIDIDEFTTIFELSKSMTMNSRATLICQLYKTSEPSIQKAILPIVNTEIDSILEITNSKSIKKHIQDLRKDIND